MSTSIENSVLKQFILKKIDNTAIKQDKATKVDVNANEFNDADLDDNGELDIDEIMDDSELLSKFATMYQDEQKKVDAEKDKEKEKEEQTQVKDKNNNTGV